MNESRYYSATLHKKLTYSTKSPIISCLFDDINAETQKIIMTFIALKFSCQILLFVYVNNIKIEGEIN